MAAARCGQGLRKAPCHNHLFKFKRCTEHLQIGVFDTFIALPLMFVARMRAGRRSSKTCICQTIKMQSRVTSRDDTAQNPTLQGQSPQKAALPSQDDTAPKRQGRREGRRVCWITSQDDTAPKQ